MAKKKSEEPVGPQAGEPGAENAAEAQAGEPAAEADRARLRERVMVKYVGENRAVLGGRMILHGETREVTRLELMLAQRNRPDGFRVVGEDEPEGKG